MKAVLAQLCSLSLDCVPRLTAVPAVTVYRPCLSRRKLQLAEFLTLVPSPLMTVNGRDIVMTLLQRTSSFPICFLVSLSFDEEKSCLN